MGSSERFHFKKIGASHDALHSKEVEASIPCLVSVYHPFVSVVLDCGLTTFL